jgi:hypothetical protein
MEGRRGALAAWCLLLVMAGQGVAAQNTTALLKVYLAFKGTAIPLAGGQESETINAMNALCNVPWDFRAQVVRSGGASSGGALLRLPAAPAVTGARRHQRRRLTRGAHPIAGPAGRDAAGHAR